MPIHVTPSELARMTGMERGEVLDTCRRNSIPVLHGRIDKSLFMLSINAASSNGGATLGR